MSVPPPPAGEPPKEPPRRPDPGWPPPSPRAIAAALIPGMLGRLADDPTVAAVTVLRRVFLGFIGALVVIGLVLLVAVAPELAPAADARVWLLLVLGAASASAGTSAVRNRRVVCAEPARLARQISAATFLGLATANTAALTGFVAAFLADALWPYLISLLPTALGLTLTAPTRRRVRELDARLELVGCHLGASDVLYAQPGDPWHPTSGADDDQR